MQEVDRFVNNRPGYQLTQVQEAAFDALIEAIEKMTGEDDQESSHQTEAKSQEEIVSELAGIDRLCLQFVMTLLDHQLGDDEYESVIISGLAVLGIREDGGWLNAEDYTTKYSGIIKITRMLVLYRSYIEREDMVLERQTHMTEAKARARTEPIFDIVQRRVRRFMTLVSEWSKPTPMDWIYECRTYGMKIRYNTTAQGAMEWEGSKVMYQKIRFDIKQLQGMVHGLVEEARRDLMELLMLEMNEDGEVKENPLPPVDWARLSDDPSEERVGWSFLMDSHNQLGVDGKWWLLKRISHEPRLIEEWIREDGDGDHPYRLETAADYQGKVEAFQEKLLLIMHIVGGQPARASELIGMRYANTKQGGLRNILIDRGLMVFVTCYHKNYRSSGNMKIIHRYLPREVGELLIRYLHLVLPFSQAVQSVIKKADGLSPFLWSDVTVKKEEKSEDKDEDEGYETGDPDSTIHHSKEWTSERLRKIMQKHSRQWLGVELNISAWRHIAIGISRRYLQGRFVAEEEDEGVDFETFDEDNIAGDSPWDLQAGHGTHVAGMIYARELRQAPGETASRRDAFRQVSQDWHRFLGFTSSIQGFGVMAGMKRPRNEWEHIARAVQQRRFVQMCNVNIRSQLKRFIGPKAEFRGLQEETIHAIMTGESPIINVMATGEGKSLLFMLPAYCVSGGTTVVIVPLNSLQEDLERRCNEAHIESVRWDPQRPREPASIMFVTPESAVTKTFSNYINWLRSTYQLDRVVMDECQVVLDSGPGFRPMLRELGAEMINMGTQLIYLTATLPPRDEEEFFRAMQIPLGCVKKIFRAATTRTNIRYQVQETGSQPMAKAVDRAVKQKLQQYPIGKIIVYGGSVEQTEALAETLECPAYHRHVDDQMGKRRRMQQLMSGTERVICATNALGLGVDIPDIRVVIHAGPPSKLRDFAQESGRAGRDRQVSESIIICSSAKLEAGHGHRSWIGLEVEDIAEFMAGHHCRRVIMDGVMDGRTSRIRCEDGEERCDVCEVQDIAAEEAELPTLDAISRTGSPCVDRPVRPEPFEDSGLGRCTSSALPGIEDSDIEEAASEDQGFAPGTKISQRFQSDFDIEAAFEQQQRERRRLEMIARKSRQEEAQEVAEFEGYLRSWVHRCPLCHLQGRSEQLHQLEECPHPEKDMVVEAVNQMTSRLVDKRQFEFCSCCFQCGVPQSICNHWVQRPAAGYFNQDKRIPCQFPQVVIPVVGVIFQFWPGDTDQAIEWMKRDGVDVTEVDNVYRWYGRKIWWGGIQATNLCKVFWMFNKMIQID